MSLIKNVASIEKEITALLKKEKKLFEKNAPLKNLYAHFAKSTTGGKYVRGTLVQLGYLLANKRDNPKLLPIAAAYEVLHTSLLIHDDIIDNSPLRRGAPSLWKKIGTNQALCLGDLGFFLCHKVVADSTFPSERKIRATSLLADIVMKTIAGEMLDIALSENPSTSSGRKEEDVITIHTLKTALYTISGPLMLGALLGGADEKMLERLKQFGEYLGIAFQIQDDILGTFGNEKELGKSVTSDSVENKNTLLIAYAVQHAGAQQKKILNKLYGKKSLSQQEFTQIKKNFEETGSLAYSQNKAHEYAERAKKIIPQITTEKKMQEILNELTEIIVERRK